MISYNFGLALATLTTPFVVPAQNSHPDTILGADGDLVQEAKLRAAKRHPSTVQRAPQEAAGSELGPGEVEILWVRRVAEVAIEVAFVDGGREFGRGEVIVEKIGPWSREMTQ